MTMSVAHRPQTWHSRSSISDAAAAYGSSQSRIASSRERLVAHRLVAAGVSFKHEMRAAIAKPSAGRSCDESLVSGGSIAGAFVAAAANINDKSNANAIATPKGGDEDVRLWRRQASPSPKRSCRACSAAMAAALLRGSTSICETVREAASAAARSRLLANTSVGQPMRAKVSTRAVCRMPSRKKTVKGSRVSGDFMPATYSNWRGPRHLSKVAQGCSRASSVAFANPVRPDPGAMRPGRCVVPARREPDAVERLPEHHRRANEVLETGVRGAHGDTLSRLALAVAPNKPTHFGETVR